MNILMMGWELPPYISGGLGTACAGILQCLQDHADIDIQFVLPHIKGGEQSCGAVLLPLAEDQDFSCFSPGGHAYGMANVLPATLYLENVVRLYPSFKAFDVIHAHDWMTFPAASFLKAATGRPLVVHLHSIERDRSPASPNPQIAEMEARGLRAADHVVAVSAYTKRQIADTYGIDPGKISVVHNVVPLQRAGRRSALPTEKIVSFIGRITSQKGPLLFVDAALEMMQDDEEMQFIMAGDGDLLPLVKSIVKANNAAHRFSFPGFVGQEQVREILSRSSVFVMPSLSEPFGIGAIEAISSRVPVVASKYCGFTEVIANVLVVDPEEPEAIAAACLDMARSFEASDQLATRAFDELAKLSPASAAGALCTIYARLAAHPACRHEQIAYA